MSRLAQVLEQRGEEIIQRWIDRVRDRVAPGGESRVELQNSMPLFLRQLIATLRGESHQDQSSPAEGHNPVGREHGAQRYRLGFELGAIVREYGLLRDLLLELLTQERLQVSLDEVRLLTNFVGTAIAEAVEEHARRQEHARQQELRRSEAWLTTVLRSIGDAVLVTDAHGRAVFLNPEAEALTGRRAEEARGEPLTRVLRLLDEATLAEVACPLERLGRGEAERGAPRLLVRPNGTHVPIDEHMAPMHDEDGRLIGAVLVLRDVSEKRRQENELRTFKTLVEASSDFIAISNPRGQVLYMNPASWRLAGFSSAEQACATPLRDMFTPRSWDTMMREAAPQTLLGQNWEGELVMRHAVSGEALPLAVRTTALKDARGQVELLASINRDLREHKRQEAERERLRARAEAERERLNALFQQAPVCIGVIRGADVTIEVANPRLCGIWGRTQEQVVGKPLLEALPELTGKGFDALLRGVMATGVPFVATELAVQFARGPNGALETGYFNFIYQALHDTSGDEGVLIIAHEVTELVLARREVETLLHHTQASEQSQIAVLDALAAQSLVAVSYQRGPEHVYQMANPLYRTLLDRDVVGRSLRQALPELLEQGFPAMLTRVYDSGVPVLSREHPVHVNQGATKPPHEFLCDFTYQPVRAADGGVDGILTLAVDVTEQVRLRREAERLAEEERTRRDFEQHLIGIVSHDLRNPLSAILLGLQVLLRREGLDARTVQTLVRLHASTERAVRMVRDLLDFTQARLGGGLKIERVPLDLHTLVRGVVEEFQLTHAERELRLEQDGDGHGQWDEDRIAQLLGNLVANALKYSPADTPIRVRGGGDEGGVWLQVHNGGAPIAPEALSRLFQPLQRAVEGSDKAGRSVGLGLYIVEQIARAHGGDVQVRSCAPEGTTFTVRLPRGAA